MMDEVCALRTENIFVMMYYRYTTQVFSFFLGIGRNEPIRVTPGRVVSRARTAWTVPVRTR